MQFLDKLLNHYSLTYEELEEMSRPIDEVSLLDPNKIEGMDKVKERILKAIKNGEKILIYGDYDCDGICASSIMKRTFELLNYPVSVKIPSRYVDGYGLNERSVKIADAQEVNLIITVDNGISAHEAIDLAVQNGIDVIVIDHHELPEEKVHAVGIIHPLYSHISEIVGSGGYMSLFVSAALLGYYDDYLVTLAGLSTISDLMELKGYNRDVVRLALFNFKNKRYAPLKYLTDNFVINEKTFSLEIAPKINAIGRMGTDGIVAVEFLLAKDIDTINKLGQVIIDDNESRKLITKEAVESLVIEDGMSAICLKTDMKEGLIGLVANRLMNEYNVPTIVFTNDYAEPEKYLKGSIRSKDGFNVTKAFEALNKYLVTGGGHALAGGLCIKIEDYEDFKRDFLALASQYPIVEEKEDVIEISLSDISVANYRILERFAPFGMGFKEPKFLIKDLPTRSLSFISEGKHLSTKLSINTKLLGFNMNENVIKSLPKIDIIGGFNLSEYRGYQTVEFRIDKYL